MRDVYRGHTLIELLVAIGIGMLLLGLVTSALIYSQRIAARSSALMSLHREASSIHQLLADNVRTQHPCVQWRLEVLRGTQAPANVWGTGDRDTTLDRQECVALTFMTTLRGRRERSFGFAAEYQTDLAWARLVWRFEPVGTEREDDPANPGTLRIKRCGTLWFARSSAWTAGAFASTTGQRVQVYPQPRGDRGRPLDDNDLRYMPGMSQALYEQISGTSAAHPNGALSDEVDLESQLRRITAPATRVDDLVLGWYDRRGNWTGIDALHDVNPQIREYMPDGTAAAWPALPYMLSDPSGPVDRLVLGGIPLSGVSALPGSDPVTVADRRPLLLQIAFTLVHDPDPSVVDDAQNRNRLRQRFAFSLPLEPIAPPFPP